MNSETLLTLGIIIVVFVSLWKIFEKAGEKGWKGIIPFYNTIILLKIVGKPWWWLLFMLIPLVGLIWQVWMTNLLSKSFGKSTGFTVGLVFLPFIFFPILGFGKAVYEAPTADEEN